MERLVLAYKRIGPRQDGKAWGVAAHLNANVIVSCRREVFRRYCRGRGEAATQVEAVGIISKGKRYISIVESWNKSTKYAANS
jgi:hypothetical protein